MEKVCITTVDTKDCFNHFYFNPFADPNLHYDIGVPLGHIIKMGNINLDSLKVAHLTAYLIDIQQGILFLQILF
jgi:hypothetical protein